MTCDEAAFDAILEDVFCLDVDKEDNKLPTVGEIENRMLDGELERGATMELLQHMQTIADRKMTLYSGAELRMLPPLMSNAQWRDRRVKFIPTKGKKRLQDMDQMKDLNRRRFYEEYHKRIQTQVGAAYVPVEVKEAYGESITGAHGVRSYLVF